jgi:hypothetical protein
MNRKKPKTMALSRETLHSLDPHLGKVAGGGGIKCSVQLCPETMVPSQVPCSAGCSVSCG